MRLPQTQLGDTNQLFFAKRERARQRDAANVLHVSKERNLNHVAKICTSREIRSSGRQPDYVNLSTNILKFIVHLLVPSEKGFSFPGKEIHA